MTVTTARPVAGSARRIRAARIARLLAPAAVALGGWASSELVVRVDAPPHRFRPDVTVGFGEPPVDGVTATPPVLVVVLDDDARVAAQWTAVGVEAVWAVADTTVALWQRGRPAVVVGLDAELVVPAWPTLRLPVAVACGLAPGGPASR